MYTALNSFLRSCSGLWIVWWKGILNILGNLCCFQFWNSFMLTDSINYHSYQFVTKFLFYVDELSECELDYVLCLWYLWQCKMMQYVYLLNQSKYKLPMFSQKHIIRLLEDGVSPKICNTQWIKCLLMLTTKIFVLAIG